MPPTVNDKSPLSPGRRGDGLFLFLFLIPLVGRVFRFFQGQNVMRKIYKTLYMIKYLLRVKMMSYFLDVPPPAAAALLQVVNNKITTVLYT